MNPNFREAWSPSAVFSPSAARQQLLEAKDWSYIDTWLSSHFSPRPVPPFERNAETLKALLALANANENADEEKHHVRRVKEKALLELKERWEKHRNATAVAGSEEGGNVGSDSPLVILSDALEKHEPEGAQSLHSLALLSVALNHPASTSTITPTTTSSSSPRPRRRKSTTTTTSGSSLATSLISLTKHESQLSQTELQLHHLHLSLHHALLRVRKTLEHDLPPPPSQLPSPTNPSLYPSPHLPQKTHEWIHTSHHLTAKSSEYQTRAAHLERAYATSKAPQFSIQKLVELEKAVVELKEHVVNLDSQVKGFQGLPPEKDMARMEVERVEELVRDLEGKREEVYDKMVSSGSG